MIGPLREILRARPGGMTAQAPQSYRIGNAPGGGAYRMAVLQKFARSHP
jgi:hypothetical protein